MLRELLVEDGAADLLVPRSRRAREEDAVDRAVLRWIARFRFVTANLLADYLGVAHQTALARVRLLVEHGYLERHPGPRGAALAVSVSARGMRALQLPPRRAPRSDLQREHELALVWLVLQLEARSSAVVFTERECRRAERVDPERRMSADVIDPAGRPARRWPDLVLRRATGDLVVLELERTLKDPTRLVRIVAGYGAAAWFSEVRLYCTDPAVARGLVAAVRRAAVPWQQTTPITVAPWPGLRSDDKTAVRSAIADA